MAFYIKPPGGVEKLPNLAAFCRKRLLFLRQVLGCDGIVEFRRLIELADTADDSECLIEGSSKDRVSHFLLRLACCQDSEMAAFLVRAETELFRHRFASMNAQELVRLLQTTHRFLLRLHKLRAGRRAPPRRGSGGAGGRRTACEDLLAVLQGMLANGLTWAEIVDGYQAGDRSQCIGVRFEQAASLVARRAVSVERGLAMVPVADILKVLAFLFERITAEGVVDAQLSVWEAPGMDERMLELFRDLQQMFHRDCHIGRSERVRAEGGVAIDDIDGLLASFPPCMRHLHQVLRRKHRLRHFSRIQYTLFLKEVGLPAAQAVTFWQREYSQQPEACSSGGASCSHSWMRDGRRYTYSIRHLYGLEGSRVDYRAHSCHSLQNCSLGHGEEGGCPFKHFDDSHLRTMMTESGITSEENLKEVVHLARQGKLGAACQAFFRKSATATLCAATPRRTNREAPADQGKSEVTRDDGGDSDFQPSEKKRARLGNRCAETEPSDFDKELLTEPSGAEDVLLSSRDHRGTRPPDSNSDSDSVEASGMDSTRGATSTGERSQIHRHQDIGRDLARSNSGEALEERPLRMLSEGDLSAPLNVSELTACSHNPGQTRGFGPTSSGSFQPAEGSWSPGSQLEAALKDLCIQNPVDFYRGYTQLLTSLRGLQRDNS